jgi:hypothetical protein
MAAGRGKEEVIIVGPCFHGEEGEVFFVYI